MVVSVPLTFVGSNDPAGGPGGPSAPAPPRVVAAGGVAERLCLANPQRILLCIAQDGTGTDKARIGSAGLTATVGWPMLAGERIILRRDEGADGELYVIAQTGTPNMVVLEMLASGATPGGR